MKRIIWIVLPVLLILTSLAGGIMIYRYGVNREKQPAFNETDEKGIIQIPSEIPKLTNSPNLDRKDLKIRILNGRGVTGTSGEARDYLESLGYRNIEIGNADSYDYKKTTISIRDSRSEYKDLLIDDLSEKYEISKEILKLNEESEFDVVIVIGDQ